MGSVDFSHRFKKLSLVFGAASCDEVLIGAGRQPNVENLKLENATVEYDARRGVNVDRTLRITNRRIYTVGDVCSPYKFTHTADASARLVVRNALFASHNKLTTDAIPWRTYTDPPMLSQLKRKSRWLANGPYTEACTFPGFFGKKA